MRSRAVNTRFSKKSRARVIVKKVLGNRNDDIPVIINNVSVLILSRKTTKHLLEKSLRQAQIQNAASMGAYLLPLVLLRSGSPGPQGVNEHGRLCFSKEQNCDV